MTWVMGFLTDMGAEGLAIVLWRERNEDLIAKEQWWEVDSPVLLVAAAAAAQCPIHCKPELRVPSIGVR